MTRGKHARARQRQRTPWAALVMAAAVGLGATSMFVAVRGGSATGDNPPAACSGQTTPVVVVSSAEKAGLLAASATSFNAENLRSKAPCVTVQVVKKSSGTAQSALAKGWSADDGPQPDVWSPSGSVWLPLLEERLKAGGRPSLIRDPANVRGFAQSPMVIAMPRPMAEALGWPGKALGWADLLALASSGAGWAQFGHPEWGKFTLGKTNPNFSHAGLEGTIATYYAATGKTSGLSLEDVARSDTRAFVAGVEQSVLRYGDTTVTFASDWYKADADGRALGFISALVTEENLVVSYNNGNPTGDPAKQGESAPPQTPLVAIYPDEGTFVADHPYAVLDADWVTAEKRAAADQFYRYLLTEPVQRIWQENHFRNAEGELDQGLGPEKGVLPTQPKKVLEPPTAEVTDAVLASWSQLRKTANVLTLVDVSGSMNKPVAGSPTTKLAAASGAIADSLKLFTDRDQVGLWSFSDRATGTDYQQLVPIGPLNGDVRGVPRRDYLANVAGSLQAVGDTALYNSLAAAYSTVTERYRDDQINAIVLLTDGRNDTAGGVPLDGLLAQIQKTYAEKPVHIIAIGYGPDADNETLARIARASKGAAYKASTTSDISKVYAAALSNF
jgi:Ca-activated chloride channel homolog